MFEFIYILVHYWHIHLFHYFFFFNFGSYKSWTSELTLPVWTLQLPTQILLQLKDEARLHGSLCLIASSNCDFKQERVLFVTNQVILVGLDMMTCPQSLSVSLNSLQRVWSRTCLLSCSACSKTPGWRTSVCLLWWQTVNSGEVTRTHASVFVAMTTFNYAREIVPYYALCLVWQQASSLFVLRRKLNGGKRDDAAAHDSSTPISA